MKEIFLNSAKCAYISVRQLDLLYSSGVISIEFLDDYFRSREYSILEHSFFSILRCLNLKKCAKFYKTNTFSDYDLEDVYGRVYNAGDIYIIFGVKHKDGWYEKFWDCVREGKDGAYKLIEEAIEDVERYNEKLERRSFLTYYV